VGKGTTKSTFLSIQCCHNLKNIIFTLQIKQHVIYPSTFENKIGFDRIRQMISENCLCELGKNLVEKMEFKTSIVKIRHELTLTEELRQILLFSSNFPQENYIDATECLLQIKVPGTYPDVADLNNLRLSLDTIKLLARFFLSDESREKYPALCHEASIVKLFPFVSEQIDRILNKYGQVKDNASPALKDIRDSIKHKQASVARRLQSILKAGQQDGLIDADAEITLRDGRPVIPVTAGNKRKISTSRLPEKLFISNLPKWWK
jgi:DNA mismatch repair protein MutS2